MKSLALSLLAVLAAVAGALETAEHKVTSAPRTGGHRSSSPQQEWCKWIPGQQGWPSDQEWAAFSNQIKGRLLKPNPPAAACHRGFTEYNKGACDTLTDGFTDSSWHSNHPTSNMWQNYNNYSCMPGASSPCTTEGFPVYVVDAREPQDVKAAVDFARNKNIRLNIKSTGHDFLGRSVQPYSLSIWTHHLNAQHWYGSGFQPKGCSITIPGHAVRVGAGSQWKDITAAAKDRNVAVVSGAFSTVSVGGFISNGGHGALSAKYGLGADQVYEIELVTAAGDIIIANECANQDYFWAMRGGGGSTYGVVLSFVIKAYPAVQAARYRSTLSGWGEITHWYKNWDKIARVGGSGYFNGYPGRGGDVSLSFTVPDMTESQLMAIVDPILAAMSSGRNRDGDREEERRKRSKAPRATHIARVSGEYTYYTNWSDAEEAHSLHKRDTTGRESTFPGIGTNKIIASWLWTAQDLANPNMPSALRNAFDNDAQMLNDATLGIGTHNPPSIRGGGNAVNPAFRTAVMRPATELQWAGTDFSLLARKKADSLRFTKSYSSINPSGGTYANEADPDTPEWQHAFWGTNYPRLLDIKKRIDPWGVFYCRSCVGSELWEDNSGQLCRLGGPPAVAMLGK